MIFMVADGMSAGIPTLAQPFSRLVRGRDSNWWRLMTEQRAVQGLFETSSLSSLVTDSAAASSAWGSGSRVFNGSLNMLPDGTKLTPIAPLVRDTGRRVGLVTTTTITHATPAGFAAAQAARDDEHSVAPQYLNVVDVLLGGGRRFFELQTREDGRDLAGDFNARGYTLWKKRADLLAGPRPSKVLGLFAKDAALDILAAGTGGFMLQIEGGRVDHAAHANDAAAALWDFLAFDDALGVVLEYAETHPDTLVIVTSDHGNSNPGLNGVGGSYANSTRSFECLARATMSVEALLGSVATLKAPSSDDVVAAVRRGTGLTLAAEDAETLRAGLGGNLPPELNHQHANAVGMLGQILGNHTGVQWTGISHTADWVLASALGPGAERFAGALAHVEVSDRLMSLLGIRFRNPRMSADDAKKYLSQARLERRPHWIA